MKDKEKGLNLIQRAFDIWYKEFEEEDLRKSNYSRLIRAAKQLGQNHIVEQVKAAQMNLKNELGVNWFNPENTATDGRIQLEDKNINYIN